MTTDSSTAPDDCADIVRAQTLPDGIQSTHPTSKTEYCHHGERRQEMRGQRNVRSVLSMGTRRGLHPILRISTHVSDQGKCA